MSGYEPVLHALSVEPRVVRPGDTVRVVFRTRNQGGVPSPAAAVRFLLPAALEPVGAREPDPEVVAVEPVAPGDEVVACLSARVAGGLDDRTELSVRAAFELPSGSLGTNACAVVVRSRPRLDGPGSGVAVLALDGEIVRVRATVVNEGDGPARNLRVTVPVPAGCVALEGEAATRIELERLAVGARAALSYDARIVAPVETVRGEAYAEAEELRCALPARETVVPGPVLAAPRVKLVPGRRRADVAIDLRNDGWAEARDVALRIALPRPLHVLDGSLAVDGVPLEGDGPNGFARAEHVSGPAAVERGTELRLTVVRVPARGGVRVVLAVRVPPACEGEVLEVVLGEHAACVPISAAAVRDVRLRVVRAPVAAEPGACVELVAELANAGDRSETLVVAAAGDGFAEPAGAPPVTVAPGAVAEVALAVRVRDDAADGARLLLCLSANDAGGAQAHAELGLSVRDRPWLALSALPAREGERVAYALRNAGSTTARAVVARVGDELHQLGAIAPGARASFAAGERAARRGGVVSVGGRAELALPTLDERLPADVRAVVGAPAGAVAGAPFALRAEIAVATAVDALALRVPAADGAVYVAGSTTLDGRPLLDRDTGSPLAGEGLLLRGVPAGTRVALAWSVLADPAHGEGALQVGGELSADGDVRAIEPVRVEIRPREMFAARPAGLAYHVDACTLAPDGTLVPDRTPASGTERERVDAAPDFIAPVFVEPTTTEVEVEPLASAAFTFALPLDGVRGAEIARLLRGAPGGRLAAQVLAVRALFPERETSGDVLVAGALGAVDEALRDVFDRLFVKLRIPGFDVAASDLEDPALRRALVRLFERLLTARPGEDPRPRMSSGGAAAEAVGRLECERVREVLSSFADAPFGAPAVLRALVALLPTRCDGDPALGAALARHAAALDAALARYAPAPLRDFDDALAGEGGAALDDARASLLSALRPHVTPAEAAS